MSQLRVAVIGGGSGGHLFPAIAVAQEIIRASPSASFLFLTSRRPIDAKVLASAGWPTSNEMPRKSRDSSSIPPEQVSVEPYVNIPGSSAPLLRMALLPSTSRAYLRAKKRLQNFAPDVVIGCGAMASIAGVYAAHRLKIPVVLMEQNVRPGKAIRVLSRFAKLTQAGLPLLPEFADKWRSEILVTGTPVRPAIAELARFPKDHSFAPSRPKLLILGGSQGSQTVNRLTLEALAEEKLLPSDWEIVHQTGESEVSAVSAEYARRGRKACVASFLPDLPHQLASASVVISRAGAGTLQELSCAGVPTILLPFSRAANDHQQFNANLLYKCEAALMISETIADAGLQLRHRIQELLQDASLQQKLTHNIRQFSRPDAASQLAARIVQIAEK